MDMFRKLPPEVITKILSYLPLKEAGRTSILSTQWRHTWTSIPELVFGFLPVEADPVNFVDAVLVLHNGPIHKFEFSAEQSYPEAFDRSIVNLSRNRIRELTIYYPFGGAELNYEMHPRFFSFEELSYVKLRHCTITVPPEFTGFNLLDTLILDDLNVSEGEIEKLISDSPLLETLKLHFQTPSLNLLINAPNLLNFQISGHFANFNLCAPKLLSLHLDVTHDEHSTPKNIEEILGNLPDLEKFELLEYATEEPMVMCCGSLREGFSLTLNRLTYFSMELDFDDEVQSCFCSSAISRSPQSSVN